MHKLPAIPLSRLPQLSSTLFPCCHFVVGGLIRIPPSIESEGERAPSHSSGTSSWGIRGSDTQDAKGGAYVRPPGTGGGESDVSYVQTVCDMSSRMAYVEGPRIRKHTFRYCESLRPIPTRFSRNFIAFRTRYILTSIPPHILPHRSLTRSLCTTLCEFIAPARNTLAHSLPCCCCVLDDITTYTIHQSFGTLSTASAPVNNDILAKTPKGFIIPE